MDTRIQPLIDGDILLHEIGWSCEFKDKESGELVLFDAEYAEHLLKQKIEGICTDVDATEPPILFFSDSEWLSKKLKRDYVKGFRYDIAKSKPYKGNRINPKPFHFYNLLTIMMSDYNCIISSNGLEADDIICLYQYEQLENPGTNPTTIICSRDKDLRICPGWHFSWECGKQKAIGPVETDTIGWIEKRDDGSVLGYGLSFFYYQLLVGDTADCIPGLPRFGKATAYSLLHNIKTARGLYEIVRDQYKETMGDKAKEYFMEQANLLWMRFNKEQTYVIPTT